MPRLLPMSLTSLSVHTAELRLEMVFVFDAGTLEGSKLKEKVHLGFFFFSGDCLLPHAQIRREIWCMGKS